MKFTPLVVLALAAPASAAVADGSSAPAQATPWEATPFSMVPRSLQKNPHLNVVIITEVTASGKALPPGSPDHPVYYLVHDSGLSTVGDVIAGERPPSAADLAEVLRKALAVSGYLPAAAGHPPALVLDYKWGSFNQLSSMDDPIGANGPEAPDDLQIQQMILRAGLVGGTDFAMEMVRALNGGTLDQFTNRDPHTTWLMQQVYSNRYFLIASAYEYKAATQNQFQLLWRTKISTDSQGVTMDESLPSLVQSSGPYFGRETAGPVRLDRQVVPEGQVHVGTPTVVPKPSEDSAPPPDATGKN